MLSALVRPGVSANVSWSAYDPRWYRDIGGIYSDSGMTVVPESALTIAAVYRAVNVMAHSVASIPLVIYRRDGEDRERAREHPSYNMLHDQPNPFQTSFRWRHLMVVQGILWGNHYSEIMPGMGGVGSLVPLSPDTTRVVDQMRDGRLIYVTQDKTRGGWGPERRLLQDEVFHVRGFSTDGKSGLPLTNTAKNAMGLALAGEKHGSMFLKKGARLNGILTSDAPMKEDVRKSNEEAWQSQYGGSSFSGGTPLLTGGIKYNPISANNKDSQWLEARAFQVQEILRFIGVPPVLVGHPEQTQSYASVEQLFLAFVTHSVRPWTENIAAELNSSVIVGAPEYFADFILEGLLRGDIKTRYDAYRLAIASGFMNRNEARKAENMNAGPPELDVFLEPLNMQEAGAEAQDSGAQPGAPNVPPVSNDSAARSQLSAIAERTAQRLVRKEIAAICGTNGRLGAAARYANNPDGWNAWLVTFYGEHGPRIAEDLSVPLLAAAGYCEAQRERFKKLPENIEDAEAQSLAALVALIPDVRIAA